MNMTKLVSLKLSSSIRQNLLCFHSRLYATKYRHTRNTYYYEVLGVQTSASQTQIKKAYFELSKKHHPDVSESEDSKLKFQMITDAYTVLGNVHSRRMYDRGLISGGRQSTPHTPQPEEPFDPFKIPTKPVQTDLDKLVKRSYREIVLERRANSEIGEDIRKKVDNKESDFFLNTENTMDSNVETFKIMFTLFAFCFGLFIFGTCMQTWHNQEKEKDKRQNEFNSG